MEAHHREPGGRADQQANDDLTAHDKEHLNGLIRNWRERAGNERRHGDREHGGQGEADAARHVGLANPRDQHQRRTEAQEHEEVREDLGR